MSGGSFDYVYLSLWYGEIEEIAKRRHDLNMIAMAIAEAGYPEAAAPVAAIVARIDALDAWAQGLAADGLPELLKAFEWWRSADRSEDHFKAELDRYLSATMQTPKTPEEWLLRAERDIADQVGRIIDEAVTILDGQQPEGEWWDTARALAGREPTGGPKPIDKEETPEGS